MTNRQLTLRSFDIPSFQKFGLGFDEVFGDLERVSNQQTDNYPPYNIIQVNDNEFTVQLAVAGFGPDNLTVTKEKSLLIVEGVPSEVDPEADEPQKILHHGIGRRSFRREFRLAEHVEIDNAHLELGILNIHLKRDVPEAAKPKTIAISHK